MVVLAGLIFATRRTVGSRPWRSICSLPRSTSRPLCAWTVIVSLSDIVPVLAWSTARPLGPRTRPVRSPTTATAALGRYLDHRVVQGEAAAFLVRESVEFSTRHASIEHGDGGARSLAPTALAVGGRRPRRNTGPHLTPPHDPGPSAAPGGGPRSALDRCRVTACRVARTSRPSKEPSRQMGLSDRNRRFSAIAIRADGRHVPVTLSSGVEVSILGKLELDPARASRPYHRLPVGAWGQAEVAPAGATNVEPPRTLAGSGEGLSLCRTSSRHEGPTTEHMEGHTPWPPNE